MSSFAEVLGGVADFFNMGGNGPTALTPAVASGQPGVPAAVEQSLITQELIQAAVTPASSVPAGTGLYDRIAANPELSTFATLIKQAGLDHFIDCAALCKGMTVFAPTNCAFRDLTLGELADFQLRGKEAPLEVLNHILRNHMVSGTYDFASLSTKPGNLTAESGHCLCLYSYTSTCGAPPVNVLDACGKVRGCIPGTYVNVKTNDFRKAAKIVTPDIRACDGIIHVVDELLLDPPCAHMVERSLWETLASSPSHSIFAKLVCAAGYKDELNDLCESGLTVFAPTDAAFRCVPAAALAKLASCPELAREVVAIHLLKCRLSTYDLVPQKAYPTLGCHTLSLRTCKRDIYVVADDADIKNPKILPVITRRNMLACNGILHSIDRVIAIVKANLIARLTQAGHFTKLLCALERAGLTEQLSGAGEGCGKWTLFAPSDDACAHPWLETLFNETATSPEVLRAGLSNHLLKGRQLIERLPLDRAIQTQGSQALVLQEKNEKLYAHLTGADPEEACVHVHCVDLIACNGVIHTIDKPLVPCLGEGYGKASYPRFTVRSCGGCAKPVAQCACHIPVPAPVVVRSCGGCAKPVNRCACELPPVAPLPAPVVVRSCGGCAKPVNRCGCETPAAPCRELPPAPSPCRAPVLPRTCGSCHKAVSRCACASPRPAAPPVRKCGGCAKPVNRCGCETPVVPAPVVVRSCGGCAKPVNRCACAAPAPLPAPAPTPCAAPPRTIPSCNKCLRPISRCGCPSLPSPPRCISRECDQEPEKCKSSPLCNKYSARQAFDEQKVVLVKEEVVGTASIRTPRRASVAGDLLLTVGNPDNWGEVYEVENGDEIYIHNGKPVSQDYFESLNWDYSESQ